MKKATFLFCSILLFIIPLFLSMDVVAETSLQVTDVENSKAANLLADYNFIRHDTPQTMHSIHSFDVRDDGMYVVADYNTNAILVYDKNGMFQYAYTVTSNGSFMIEWVDDFIAVYFTRNNYRVLLNTETQNHIIQEVLDSEHNNAYRKNEINVTTRVVNGEIYTLRNDGWLNFGNVSFGKLVKKSSDGTEIVLCDVSQVLNTKTVLLVSVFILFFGMVAYLVLVKGLRRPAGISPHLTLRK